MNLVNFTYHMQFFVIFLNNNNPNTTRRMNIDVRDNKTMISEIRDISRRNRVKTQINRLQSVYDNMTNTVKKSQTNTSLTLTNDFNSKNYKRHVRLKQWLNLKRKLKKNETKTTSYKSRTKTNRTNPLESKSRHLNIIERRKKKARGDVKKLIGLFKRNISRLDKEDIDLVKIDDLTGNRRMKRAMSILVRSKEESDVDLAGLPNQLAPKYQAMKKKKDEITAYGKLYMNLTNRNSEEELHFMNYTDLQNEWARDRENLGNINF